jgi:phospholipase C
MRALILSDAWKAIVGWVSKAWSRLRNMSSAKAPLPGKIDHVIVVMLENRSFDHLLGYLSLSDGKAGLAVEGLRSDQAWQDSYTNLVGAHSYPIHRLAPGDTNPDDPPHDKSSINTQIHTAPKGPGPDEMGGFVQSFLEAHPDSVDPGFVMGHYDASTVPTYDFLSRNFCVCDHWFASVPLGTQANRLMAMSGESKVVDNIKPLPDQQLVYDWLDARHVPWNVYVSGGYAPFFLMMGRWAPRIVESLALGNGNFHRYGDFQSDWVAAKEFASVAFIEPQYSDAPMSQPNDDHPPTAPISRGQAFVSGIYDVLISNPARWAKTLMIVTYDEHGGFFDHVPPLSVGTTIGTTTLTTTGIRVPALLISPYVGEGQVFSEALDHTSILQFLGERFASDGTYSSSVSNRQQHFGRIANALSKQPRATAPVPPKPASSHVLSAEAPAGVATSSAPQTPNAAAIDAVARDMARKHPEWMNAPGWQQMKQYLDSNPPPEPEKQGRIN